MKALRLLTEFKKPTFSPLSQRLISLIAVFSSSSASNPRFSKSFLEDDDQEGSAVYRHALKFQRPTTIEWCPWLDNLNLANSASFIGTVIQPPRVVNNKNDGPYCVHALLSVRNSPQSDSTFWILLVMWEEMAELSIKHLKSNDFIYVSGRLGSYTKTDQNGILRLCHKLVVKELNYVAQPAHGSSSKTYKEPQSDTGGADVDKYKDRLHLWQVFFANPYEWWDNRKEKRNPKQPDFKHKDTGESLWLWPVDPSWIKRQLQLLDNRMEEQVHGQRRSRISKWEYDE